MHIPINSTFVFISVTVLTFIISTKNILLKEDFFLAIQLILTIPFFIYSNIARSRVILTPSRNVDGFGSWSYTIGLIFFLNSAGILISTLTYPFLGIIFLSTTIILMLLYESLARPIHYERIITLKIPRWIILLVSFIVLGLLPILKIY